MAADWTYAPKGTAYPVQRGDTWMVGPHVFHCSDLMADRTFDRLLATLPAPTLLYADPPWNQSNINSFRTKAGLERADHQWDDLYRRIIEVAPAGIPLYLEGGNRQADHVQSLLPGPYLHLWPITYYRRHACALHHSSPIHQDHPDLSRLDDDDTPGAAMRHWPAGIVVDPTAGRGLISRQAWVNGWVSYNNELNPYRMSVALHDLAALTGLTPTHTEGPIT